MFTPRSALALQGNPAKKRSFNPQVFGSEAGKMRWPIPICGADPQGHANGGSLGLLIRSVLRGLIERVALPAIHVLPGLNLDRTFLSHPLTGQQDVEPITGLQERRDLLKLHQGLERHGRDPLGK
jgi:hypothetical protein